MSARIAPDDFRQGLAGMLQKNIGESGRKWRSQGVAITRCVFHGNEPVFARNAHADGAPGIRQLVNHRGDFGIHTARGNFGFRKIAELQQQIVDAVGMLRLIIRFERLQLGFDLVERRGIEQFAQIGVAEKLFQLRLVDR